MKKYKSKKNEKGVSHKSRMTKLCVLIVLALIAALLMTELVAAAGIVDGFRNLGGRVGGFFDDYANNEEPTVIDIFLFAVIFITLCYVAFKNVFKDAKNANVVLAISVGAALSIALVYGGKFTIKKLLPFAGVILFLLIFLGIFAMLKKFIFTKDTIISKILSVVVALIVAFALLAVMWNMVCNDSGACESNGMLRKIIGSESWIGKLFAGFDGLFVGLPPPPAPSERPLPGQVIENCGNGRIDRGETCDPGGRGGARRMTLHCNEGETCDNCQRCMPMTDADMLINSIGSNWMWIVAVLAFLLLSGLTLYKRKSINEKYKEWQRRRGKRHHKKKVEALLRDVESEEKEMLNHFKELCKIVGDEKVTLDGEVEVMDLLASDMKETIGGQIEFVKTATTGPGGTIFNHVDRLRTFNDVTEKNKINLILNEVQSQLNKLKGLPAAFTDELKELEKVDELFDSHSELLKTFKQFDLSQKDFIGNMIVQIEGNRKKFEETEQTCTRMVDTLNTMIADLHSIEGKKEDYHDIVAKIKDLRLNSQRLRQMFSWKVSNLKMLMTKMNEVKGFIHELHEKELKNLEDNFLENAKRAQVDGKYDTAVYFASHFIESARELIVKEMSAKDKDELQDKIRAAKTIIIDSLPKVFESMKPKIESEINAGFDTGDRKYFEKLMRFAESLQDIDFISSEHNSEFNAERIAHNTKMQKLYALAEALYNGAYTKDELWNIIS